MTRPDAYGHLAAAIRAVGDREQREEAARDFERAVSVELADAWMDIELRIRAPWLDRRDRADLIARHPDPRRSRRTGR